MGGDIQGEWTERRCDHCESLGGMPQIGRASKSSSKRASTGYASRMSSATCSAKTVAPTTQSKPKPVSTTDKPIRRFFLKPDGSNNGDTCQHAHPRTNGKCLLCGSEAHNLQECTCPRRQQSSWSNSKPAFKKDCSKPKTPEAQSSKAPASSDKNKGKGRSKGKDKKNKPSAKSEDVDFDEAKRDDQAEDDDHADGQEEEDPEVYFADAQSSDSEVDLIGQQASAWITKKVHLLLLHALLHKTLKNLLMIHGMARSLLPCKSTSPTQKISPHSHMGKD